MRLIRRSKHVQIAIGLSIWIAAGCTSKSSVDSSDSSPASFTISAVEAIAPASFKLDSTGRAYFSSYNIRIQGACSRGATSIQYSVNGVTETNQLICPLSGLIDFTKIVTADGAYDFIFTPILLDGSASSSLTTLKTYVKTNTPPPPVILDVSPMQALSSPVVIHGTYSNAASDGIATIVLGGATGTLSMNSGAGTFTYTVPIGSGASYNLTFQSRDYAGNVSTTVPFIIYTTSSLALASFVGAASSTSMTSTNTLSAFAGAPVFVSPKTSGTSANKLYMGAPAGASFGP